MGVKISKFFKLLLNFPSNGPPKLRLGFFFIFLTIYKLFFSNISNLPLLQ